VHSVYTVLYITNINMQAFSEDDDSGLDDDTRAAAQLTALTEVSYSRLTRFLIDLFTTLRIPVCACDSGRCSHNRSCSTALRYASVVMAS
jgi:hypothetical protein